MRGVALTNAVASVTHTGCTGRARFQRLLGQLASLALGHVQGVRTEVRPDGAAGWCDPVMYYELRWAANADAVRLLEKGTVEPLQTFGGSLPLEGVTLMVHTRVGIGSGPGIGGTDRRHPPSATDGMFAP